ncbi:HdeD family acid-resistance protein [Terrabacter sp. BE26]|uniref:HdeD family acid-resistance protein n=1 Tax=Terrabacter sp. BE26 TaxID=2898152 RepID=UPI0035BE11C4
MSSHVPDAPGGSAWATTTGDYGPPARWSGAVIAIGVLSVVLGVIALVWPDVTLLVVAILFGIQLITAGAIRVSVTRELPSQPGWVRPVSMGLGVLTVIAGVICLFRPGTSLFVIAFLIAVGWIAEGIGALAHGFAAGRSAGARVFLIVFGVISVIAGIVVAAWPGETLVILARVAGILLIVLGIAELITVFVARRVAKTATAV